MINFHMNLNLNNKINKKWPIKRLKSRRKTSPTNRFISFCSFASRKIAMVEWLTAIYRPRS